MIDVKFNCRTFLNHRNQVVVRARWNKKRSEVGFSIGLHADPSKWNADTQRPVRGSTHVCGQKRIPSRVINDRIEMFLLAVKEAFVEFGLKDMVPEADELRERVNEIVGRVEDEEEEQEVKPLKAIFDEFLASGKKERDWTDVVHYKYEQVWKHLTQCDPTVSLETLDKDKMLELKDWYVKNQYKNRTITKQFRFLKSFLRWMKANGYPVKESAIDCQVHLTVTKKNVTFLTFKELMQFYRFKFAPEHKYLDKARDMFCFMSFTSLRYSDLAQLKRANITSRGIELYTKKTSTPITIPIIDYAQEIFDKYSSYQSPDGSLFPVPSCQKLNDYIKLAAEQAGIDREVVNTYFIGTKRYDEVHKFYEIIGCHDGRRTFVCCSLALGIPPSVVMSCTGHKDYQSLKPYIEVASETQRLELSKWNGKDTKVGIITALEGLDAHQLELVYDFVKSIANKA